MSDAPDDTADPENRADNEATAREALVRLTIVAELNRVADELDRQLPDDLTWVLDHVTNSDDHTRMEEILASPRSLDAERVAPLGNWTVDHLRTLAITRQREAEAAKAEAKKFDSAVTKLVTLMNVSGALTIRAAVETLTRGHA
ncbi:MAG: hypothetical protein NVV57_10740 [Demequina sp.]|jgi:hypothetical protein|nr:hypothetical protein [Demequina sp.]